MQKTAYEMRISDLSADVCSSDLRTRSAAETLDATVLIAFTYWLRGFELSTPDFVATRFLRRPGTLSADGKWLHIRLAPLAFDMVLGRAGYLDPVLLPDWLGGLRVSFEHERTPWAPWDFAAPPRTSRPILPGQTSCPPPRFACTRPDHPT